MSYERQLELEQEMLSLGEEKFRDDLDASDDFDSPHIQKVVSDMIVPFSKIIEKAIKEETESWVRGHKTPLMKLNEKHFFINALSKREIEEGKERDTTVQPIQLSFLTIRAMFISLREGMRKETVCNRDLGILINDNIINEEKYSEVDEIRIGSILNSLLINNFSKWFEVVWDDKTGQYKNPMKFIDGMNWAEYVFCPSEEFMDFCNEIIEAIAEISAIIHPMIFVPEDWDEEGRNGGFYSEQLKRNIIKKKSIKEPSGVNAIIVNGVNAIQSTPWKVNGEILDVLLQLQGSPPDSLPKVFPLDVEDNPEKPWADVEKEIQTEEQVMDTKLWWRKVAKLTKERQAKRSVDLSTTAAILQAKKFRDEDFLYFPHDLDYRDRIYNKCMTGLNTQGSDGQKGLLKFGASRPVMTDSGKRWMMINMANLVGHDKLKLDDRVAWTISNEQLLRDVVSDPLTCKIWHEWDKPVQGLASAMEYVKWLDDAERPINLHVQLDGLCNGVQHLAAITRDDKVAPHVGLIWTPERGDVYQYVCNEVINQIQGGGALADEWIRSNLLDRSLTKTPVMTRSYGAKLYGIKEGIQEYIDDKKMTNHFTDVFEAGNWMGERVWDAMTEALTGPMAFMEWAQTCAGILAKYNKPMVWKNAVGGICRQSPFKTQVKRVKVNINGRRVDYQVQMPTTTIDKGKAEASSSPNLIHGNDASHLLLTTDECRMRRVTKFAMVHDSFGCHPDDAETLLRCAKISWVDMYSKDWMQIWYEGWCNQLGSFAGDLPKPPKMGNLDIRGVMDSDFFFA